MHIGHLRISFKKDFHLLGRNCSRGSCLQNNWRDCACLIHRQWTFHRVVNDATASITETI